MVIIMPVPRQHFSNRLRCSFVNIRKNKTTKKPMSREYITTFGFSVSHLTGEISTLKINIPQEIIIPIGEIIYLQRSYENYIFYKRSISVQKDSFPMGIENFLSNFKILHEFGSNSYMNFFYFGRKFQIFYRKFVFPKDILNKNKL